MGLVISKERSLYILGVIVILFAAALAILGWVEGDLSDTVFFGAVSVAWLIYTIVELRNIHRQRKAAKKQHATLRTLRSRRKIILLKIFWLFMLIIGIAGLAIVLVRDMPLDIILHTVFIIILGAGQFLFSIFMPDE